MLNNAIKVVCVLYLMLLCVMLAVGVAYVSLMLLCVGLPLLLDNTQSLMGIVSGNPLMVMVVGMGPVVVLVGAMALLMGIGAYCVTTCKSMWLKIGRTDFRKSLFPQKVKREVLSV